MPEGEGHGRIQGFLAGGFSGMAKVITGHPFDTIKVRLQAASSERFTGPWACVRHTLRSEGVRGFYKGLVPPLIGFVFMDSLLLGSYNVYRGALSNQLGVSIAPNTPGTGSIAPPDYRSTLVNFLAGGAAGWTVSFIAAPIEHIKARLQVQYTTKTFTGPLDCAQKLHQEYGLQGIYRGFFSTVVFRSFFAVFFASYDIFNRTMQNSTNLSLPLINFTAAGLAAQLYWIAGYPTDVIKQRIMTAPFPVRTVDGVMPSMHVSWSKVARTIYREKGWRGFWRGFVPCFLRAFPANAMSIMTFEAVMRTRLQPVRFLSTKDSRV